MLTVDDVKKVQLGSCDRLLSKQKGGLSPGNNATRKIALLVQGCGNFLENKLFLSLNYQKQME